MISVRSYSVGKQHVVESMQDESLVYAAAETEEQRAARMLEHLENRLEQTGFTEEEKARIRDQVMQELGL